MTRGWTNERKQRRPPDPPGHSWVQCHTAAFSLHDLKPPVSRTSSILQALPLPASFNRFAPASENHCLQILLPRPPLLPFSTLSFHERVLIWGLGFSLTTSQLPTEQRLNSEWPTTCLTLLQQAEGDFLTQSLTVQAAVCPSVCLTECLPDSPLVHFLLFPFAFSPHICCQSPFLNLYTSSVAVFSICCLLFNPVFFLCVVPLLFNTSYLLRLPLILLSHQADRPAEWHN